MEKYFFETRSVYLKITFVFLCYELKINEGADRRAEGKSLCSGMESEVSIIK
jgi:hypothetical protein